MRAAYLISSYSTPEHYILYRKTEIDGNCYYEIWNSRKERKWIESDDAFGVFFGFEDDTRYISEEEVVEILANFGETLQPYVYKKEGVKQTVA